MKYTRELTFRRKTFSLRDAMARYVDDDDVDNNNDCMFPTYFPPVFSSFIPFVASDASVDLRHFLFLFQLTLHSLEGLLYAIAHRSQLIAEHSRHR